MIINLDYGITLLEGDNGAMFFEGNANRLYIVTQYSKELNSVRNCLTIATSHKEAWAEVDKHTLPEDDYKAISSKLIYDMMKELEGVLNAKSND